MDKPAPILIKDLIYEIDHKLIELLKSLTPDDWDKPTLASQWSVRDIAVHLLDGNLRSLSSLRDGYFPKTPHIDSYSELLTYLNQLNSDWVKAMKRLSPKVIIALLEATGKEYCDYITGLPLYEKAVFSVAWAGENESMNWFHIAREYTEKWHHQQQIRHALDQCEPLMSDHFFYPYLNTSVRALPHHYRNFKGKADDIIQFNFVGTDNYAWLLIWENERWQLYQGNYESTTTEVSIPNDISWRVFTKGISREEAVSQSEIIGNKELGRPVFDMIAVMA